MNGVYAPESLQVYAYLWPEPQNGQAYYYDEEHLKRLRPPRNPEEKDKLIAELRASRNGLSVFAEGWDSVELEHNLVSPCSSGSGGLYLPLSGWYMVL